jgi:hypothetical protein
MKSQAVAGVGPGSEAHTCGMEFLNLLQKDL